MKNVCVYKQKLQKEMNKTDRIKVINSSKYERKHKHKKNNEK